MSTGDKITPDDLLDAMAEAGVLDTFCHLPEASKREFEEWIGKARDNDNHWRRIDVLVRAMRSSPPLATEMSSEEARVSRTGER